MKDIVEDIKTIISDRELSRRYSMIVSNGAEVLIGDDLLQQVPGLRSIASGLKLMVSLRERNLLKQTSAFVLGLDSGSLDQDEYEKYRANLNRDVFMREELERVLVVLDGNPDWERSYFLGRCYREFVLRRISLERFSELREAADRVFISDIRLLERVYDDEDYRASDDEAYRIDRLVGLGLPRRIDITWDELEGEQLAGSVRLTPLGREFGRILTLPHPIWETIDRSSSAA